MIHMARGAITRERPPHFSLVVPCYNYGRFLHECVGSILSQPGVTAEILIVDDASTDGSVLVAEELAAQHRQVSLIAHQENKGHIASYNEGLALADSDYVVLLSADDMLTAGSLGRAAALMDRHPSVGLVYGHPQEFAEQPSLRGDAAHSWSVWSGENWLEAQFRRGLNIISSPEAVLRTSVQHEIGYYRPALPHSGDLEMWLRAADVADVGRINGPDQAYRRVHPASMMLTQYGSVLKDLVERNRAYESFLTASAMGTDRAGKLRRIMQRRLCNEALEWAIQSIRFDWGTEDDRAAAIDFSAAIYANHKDLDAWYAYMAIVGEVAADSPIGRARIAKEEMFRTLGNKFRWRRWRHLGI